MKMRRKKKARYSRIFRCNVCIRLALLSKKLGTKHLAIHRVLEGSIQDGLI